MYYNHPLMRTPSMSNHSPHSQKSLIKVSGEGEVSINPDTAIITLGVITENKLLSEAQNENNMLTNRVISALLKQGIAREDIQTANFNIDMQYDYQDGKQLFRGYRVSHVLQVTVRQIDKTGQLVDIAVSNGANQVSNIEFTLANPAPVYNEALVLALQNSQQKAKTIATNLGVQWNSIPSKITETTQMQLPPVPYQTAFTLKSEATPIQPGELTVKARIEAEFNFSS
jgi:uncharacterized protein